jgi:addiction module HigA family antidote
MVHTAKRNSDRCPTHPGALLREDVIPATDRTKAQIAQLLGISRQYLYDILRERKPASPAVAVRLDKLFGDGVRSVGGHAGRVRYMERRAQGGCPQDSASSRVPKQSSLPVIDCPEDKLRRATAVSPCLFGSRGDTGNLGYRVPLIGRLQRSGQEHPFVHRLRRNLR